MNGRCPAETSLISFSLYLLELFGFSLVTLCSALAWHSFTDSKLGMLSFSVGLSWCCWPKRSCLSLVLVQGKKRSGLADPAGSQEAEPDGSWLLVSGWVSLVCVSFPHPLLCVVVTLIPPQTGERSGMGEVEMLPLERTPA